MMQKLKIQKDQITESGFDSSQLFVPLTRHSYIKQNLQFNSHSKAVMFFFSLSRHVFLTFTAEMVIRYISRKKSEDKEKPGTLSV